MIYEYILPILFMATLGTVLSVLLALANKKLYVYEDPRIDEVTGMLPGTNCGACGQPGCRAFAEAAVGGKLAPNQCTVNPLEEAEKIAEYLGVSLGATEKRTARLLCAGGTNVARQIAEYSGYDSCRASALVQGGHKGCSWGCLGLADCEKVCEFGAIKMNPFSLPEVDTDLCTACGDCVDVCPKDLFVIVPLKQHLWVACASKLADEEALAECEVACTGCGLCAADSDERLIDITENLAVINSRYIHTENQKSIERCPTGAIVWMQNGIIQKGPRAKRVIRTAALEVGVSLADDDRRTKQ